MPQKKALQKGSPETRDRLIQAAARVFGRRGYAGATIRDIAKEANVSLALLYFYFKSKEDFAAAVFDQGLSVTRQQVERDIGWLPPGTPLDAVIKAAIFSHLSVNMEHGDTAAALRYARDIPIAAGDHRQFRMNVHRYRDLWKRLFEEGQKTGALRDDISPGLLLFFMFGSIMWLSEWYNPERMPMEVLTDKFIKVMFEGIQAKPGADPARTQGAAPKRSPAKRKSIKQAAVASRGARGE